jgi:hypothetical protein
MSKTIFDEAIAEAKLLRETAEKNAKNAIIEAVTPKIRSFIEDQLIGSEEDLDDGSSDILSEVASSIVSNRDSDSSGSVVIDETGLSALLEMFGGSALSSKQSTAVNVAMKESIKSMSEADREKLASATDKLNNTLDLFESGEISNITKVQQERSGMSGSDEVLYEVDLDELASSMSSLMHEEADLPSPDMEEMHHAEMEEGQISDEEVVEELSDGGDDSEALKEIMMKLGLGESLDEAVVRLEIPDWDPEDPDAQILASLELEDEDEEESDEDVEVALEDDEEGEEEEDVEEFNIEDLAESYNIDPDMLRSELKRLRRGLAEAKELAKLKGIKDAKEAHFGGKGNGKAGVKGAYGGSGTGKAGVMGAYGGGKAGGDPLKVTLNKLSEALKKERLNNRSLKRKLTEYRSAVETLREQLTDLNLFNAKLLYVNKLLQNKDVTSDQRRSVVESIDKAKSLREVKLVYRTLTESFSKRGKSNLRESASRRVMGSSSRTTGRASAESVAGEVDRWAKLAGLNEVK